MPIQSNDYFQPTDPVQSHLMDDQFLQGGYKVVLDMDGLNYLLDSPEGLKVGMLVFVQSEKKFFQLEGTQQTKPYWHIPTFIASGFTRFDTFQVSDPKWVEADFGGGPLESVAFPFVVENKVLKMDPSVAIPAGGQPGQFLIPNDSGTLEWIDPPAFGLQRGSDSFTSPLVLNQGDSYNFSLSVAKALMILRAELSASNIKIEGFSDSKRDELNPWTYVSHPDLPFDQGITVQADGTQIKHRRHSFLANTENPVTNKIYFRMTNVGQTPVSPTLTLSYLILEE